MPFRGFSIQKRTSNITLLSPNSVTMDAGDGSRCVRPDNDPGNDKAQHGTETEALNQDDTYGRSPEHEHQTNQNR
jgi:hypothetical protein